MVQVARNDCAHLAPLPDQFADFGEGLVGWLRPIRCMQDDDDFGVQLFAKALALHNPLKVMKLPDVDVVAERYIDAPDPPVVGKPESEIAPLLPAAPGTDGRCFVAELGCEGGETIVPVMIAGNEEQFPIRLLFECIGAECPIVGIETPFAILFERRVRVGEVTTPN